MGTNVAKYNYIVQLLQYDNYINISFYSLILETLIWQQQYDPYNNFDIKLENKTAKPINEISTINDSKAPILYNDIEYLILMDMLLYSL